MCTALNPSIDNLSFHNFHNLGTTKLLFVEYKAKRSDTYVQEF